MQGKLWIIASLSALALALTGCEHPQEVSEKPPATVVPIPGSDLNEVVLSQEAYDRVGIELVSLKEAVKTTSQATIPSASATVTAAVTSTTPQTSPSAINIKEVPYSAIIYGLHGETWVYTQIKPLTFVRTPVVIERIEGNIAMLSSGPTVDTQVVSVGASQLYGSEYIGNIEP